MSRGLCVLATMLMACSGAGRPPEDALDIIDGAERCEEVRRTMVQAPVWLHGVVADHRKWGGEERPLVVLTQVIREDGGKFFAGDSLYVGFECYSPPHVRGSAVPSLDIVPRGAGMWVWVTPSATARGTVSGFAFGTDER